MHDKYTEALLTALKNANLVNPGEFQDRGILRNAAESLGIRGAVGEEQRLLLAWQQLFQSNILVRGCDLNNCDFPFLHLSNLGKQALEELP